MTTATEPKVVVAPFAIVADHPRNCDLLIQCIPGCRLRSRITSMRTVKDAKTGDQMIPVDQARSLAMLPEIPGMELHVNPAKLTYVIFDPLDKDEELCEKIRRQLTTASAIRVDSKLKGVKAQEGVLDVHRMKSLVREMAFIVNSGEAKLAKGSLPSEEDIDCMPGNFLLNPGSRVQNQQPQFEKDWDSWLAQLTRSGG